MTHERTAVLDEKHASENAEQQILQTLARINSASFVSAWPATQRWFDVALARMEARGLIKKPDRNESGVKAAPHLYSITAAGRAHLLAISKTGH